MNAPAQTPPKIGPGTIIGGDYKIVRPLAKGAMGAVFVAEQQSTGVERALKLMHLQLTNNPKALERFMQEAKISARLDSDHVVRVLGAGLDDTQHTPWIAMELLQGQDLGAVARDRGRLPPGEVLEIFRQLVDGLTVAHAANVVHRDLKLENIFIATPKRSGVPFTLKILDFGISKVVQDFDANMTAAVGSPMWMAPEQSKRGTVSPATDVWPLGLIAFRLLTGKNYWKAAQVARPPVQDVLLEVMAGTLDPPTVRAPAVGANDPLPAGFDAWFAKCVARDPAQRYQSAAEALAALEPVLMGVAVRPAAPAPLAPAPVAQPSAVARSTELAKAALVDKPATPTKRSPLVLVLVVLVLLVAIAGAAAFALRR